MRVRSRLSISGPTSQPEKDEQRSIDSHQVLIRESPHASADLRPGHGRDFVHHQATRRPKAVFCVRLDR